MPRGRALPIGIVISLIACCLPVWAATQAPRSPAVAQTVYFPSRDGRTELVAYLFEPGGTGPHPAVVMLHGRAGPYSANVNAGCTLIARDQTSACNGATLSKRHEMWGEYWVRHGYIALLVDSFGPRGRGHGYGRGTHDDADRAEVNELTVRPLDAQGALGWLASRNDVRPDRIMLQGWSNGGSTTLNVIYNQALAAPAAGTPRFRAALAFYPGCGPRALVTRDYKVDTPLWVFLGSDDEEVSPTVCANLLRKAATSKMPVEVTTYEGATHDFDDPGAARQAIPGNRAAKEDAMNRSAVLFDSLP